MALHFNFQDVLNHEEVTTDPNDSENWHPVADALVWLSMICGYGRIDSKNVETVTKRIMAYQAVTGGYLSFKKKPVYITPADINRFIGMRTNASTMTDAQWLKRLGAIAQDQGKYLTMRLEGEGHFPALYEIQRIADEAKLDKEAAAAIAAYAAA